MPDGRAPASPTRERILDAALDLFVEQGVRGTTISDIERQVGLAAGTGSFYRHFPSKEALLPAAVEREAAQCMAEVHGPGHRWPCRTTPRRSSPLGPPKPCATCGDSIGCSACCSLNATGA